jgi:hypothetical protein
MHYLDNVHAIVIWVQSFIGRCPKTAQRTNVYIIQSICTHCSRFWAIMGVKSSDNYRFDTKLGVPPLVG